MKLPVGVAQTLAKGFAVSVMSWWCPGLLVAAARRLKRMCDESVRPPAAPGVPPGGAPWVRDVSAQLEQLRREDSHGVYHMDLECAFADLPSPGNTVFEEGAGMFIGLLVSTSVFICFCVLLC